MAARGGYVGISEFLGVFGDQFLAALFRVFGVDEGRRLTWQREGLIGRIALWLDDVDDELHAAARTARPVAMKTNGFCTLNSLALAPRGGAVGRW